MAASLSRRGWIAAAGFAALGALTLGALLTPRPGMAEDKPEPTRERFDLKVREDFFAGIGGDEKAMERGMKACEEILKKNPKHGEALVWHGSGLISQAGKLFGQGKQDEGLAMFRKALQEMDDAVKYEPDNIGVRIPRAATLTMTARFVPVPEQQKLLARRAAGDYEKVYGMQKSMLDKLGVHPRGELLFGLAENYRRLGDEEKVRTYLKQIQETCKDSEWDKEAKLWLEKDGANGGKTEHQCIGCHTKS